MGNDFICTWGGRLADPQMVACCSNQDSKYCQATSKNKCSKSFNNMGTQFYNYCPQITNQKCGVPGSSL